MPTTARTIERTTPVTVLADLRRERAAQPARALAAALVDAYRAHRAAPPESLLDARRTCHSARFRALCPKLEREIGAALAAGVSAFAINRAIRHYADAIAPVLPCRRAA